ncbi:MAG: four helix bundle protein [Acidobacteria bacterium]|nr:four helix bundle protein [Acidobacteriota bacterium]
MGAKTHRELRFWQLAHELRGRIYAITERGDVARNGNFCTSARKTIAQVCRRIAEGFGRYGHAQFAQYVDIALGSLRETEDHLDEALAAKYVSEAEYAELCELAEHARACGLKLLGHLSPDHRSQTKGSRSHAISRRHS